MPFPLKEIRLLGWTVVFAGLFVFLIAGARLAGTAASIPAAAALDTGECSQPCWQGIEPGVTWINRAQGILAAREGNVEDVQFPVIPHLGTGHVLCWAINETPPWSGCAIRRPTSASITLVDLRLPIGALRLGEAMMLFGMPRAAEVCRSRFSGEIFGRVHFETFIEISARGMIALTPSGPRLDPHMSVTMVRYHRPSEIPPYRFDMTAWRGFSMMENTPFC